MPGVVGDVFDQTRRGDRVEVADPEARAQIVGHLPLRPTVHAGEDRSETLDPTTLEMRAGFIIDAVIGRVGIGVHLRRVTGGGLGSDDLARIVADLGRHRGCAVALDLCPEERVRRSHRKPGWICPGTWIDEGLRDSRAHKLVRSPSLLFSELATDAPLTSSRAPLNLVTHPTRGGAVW